MYIHSTTINNGILTRDERKVDKAKDVDGRKHTNGAKFVNNRQALERIEASVIDVIDYRILRKSGALRR